MIRTLEAKLTRYEAVVKVADDLVASLWDLEWAEDMVIGPKLRAFQGVRGVIL